MAIVCQKGFLPAPKLSIVCVYIYISIVFWCCGFHVSCPVNKAPLTYRLKELNKTNKTNICICMCILYTYIYIFIHIYIYTYTYTYIYTYIRDYLGQGHVQTKTRPQNIGFLVCFVFSMLWPSGLTQINPNQFYLILSKCTYFISNVLIRRLLLLTKTQKSYGYSSLRGIPCFQTNQDIILVI